jgi:hypothetical protein
LSFERPVVKLQPLAFAFPPSAAGCGLGQQKGANMLSICTSPNEVSLVLELSDASWLCEAMSLLAELYRRKAEASEGQFGDDNWASASLLESERKSIQMSVALQQALSRGFSEHVDNEHHEKGDQSKDEKLGRGLALPALTIAGSETSAPANATKQKSKGAKRTRRVTSDEPEPGSDQSSKRKRTRPAVVPPQGLERHKDV